MFTDRDEAETRCCSSLPEWEVEPSAIRLLSCGTIFQIWSLHLRVGLKLSFVIKLIVRALSLCCYRLRLPGDSHDALTSLLLRLSLLSTPTGRGRCSPTLSLVLRVLPVEREFFLSTVAHVGMLGLFKVKTWRVRFRTCSMCEVPWDNSVVIWRYTNKDWLTSSSSSSSSSSVFSGSLLPACLITATTWPDAAPTSVLWTSSWSNLSLRTQTWK